MGLRPVLCFLPSCFGPAQAYERQAGEDRRVEEECRRQDHVRDRLFKQDLELERKEKEAKERR